MMPKWLRRTIMWTLHASTVVALALFVASGWYWASYTKVGTYRGVRCTNTFVMTEGRFEVWHTTPPLEPEGFQGRKSVKAPQWKWADRAYGVSDLGVTTSMHAVPLWPAVAILLGAAAASWIPAARRMIRRRAGRCAECGYDRRGLADDSKCPECGTVPTK
jgi:hypothetical protein